MSTSLTPAQQAALQKFQAFAQQQQKEIPTLTINAFNASTDITVGASAGSFNIRNASVILNGDLAVWL